MLLHPAIQKMFPAEKRIILPERLTVCGGPMLTEAMRHFAREIERLGR
jgi:iron complex transport system substrate-binding protein